jgi:hypothetical protein
MSRMRTIRANAPALLCATKEALKHLLRQEPHELKSEEQQRQAVMSSLRDAIDAAEPSQFDEISSSVRLTMTAATWGFLHKTLKDRARSNRDDKLVLEAALEGLRETKQRIYLTLGINHRVLRRLAFVLKHTASPKQDKPFKRMAEQIEKDGLTKNPMEILAHQGL